MCSSDLDHLAAAGTDRVMVVARRAGHVRVGAGRQVDPLQCARVQQQLQRPEDRGAAQGEAAGRGFRGEVRGGEVPGPGSDQLRDEAARRGLAGGHLEMILSLRNGVQPGDGAVSPARVDRA